MSIERVQKKGIPLPSLRNDLRLYRAAASHDGRPNWTLFDPLRNKYYQIGWTQYQLLTHWDAGTVESLIETVTQSTTHTPTHQEIEQLVVFLYVNNLARDSATGQSQAFLSQAKAGQKNWLIWLIHNYLFFKIPLVRPHAFLKATLPLVTPFFSKTAGVLILLSGLIGLFLVSRQWESFLGTFHYFFNREGMIYYGLTLVAVKIFHELGHAYTATRYGCRVHTMGVAFLVMFPVLFSDTTDAWRVSSRKHRIQIGAAGMVVELSIAMVATLCWNFLPDGLLRSAMFFLATASWVIGLFVNLNPCLRFDGYYILSDWLGVPNLQERAFAFGRWRLRKLLFGIEELEPETVPSSLRRTLIVYAWSTWIYRFVLFIGIALIVYHFFFKLLGILLFAVEIIWFILLPIAGEVKSWWRSKREFAMYSRFWVSVACVLLAFVLLVVPWSSRLSIPAVLEASPHATLFAPTPARIVKVAFRVGQVVSKGDPLLMLESPTLEKELTVTQQEIALLEYKLRRQMVHAEELQQNHVISKTLESRMAQLAGLMKQRDNLVLRSPISGIITDRAESLDQGRWINEQLPLAYVIDHHRSELQAMAVETDLPYLEVGQMAWFYPDDPMRPPIQARVREIRMVDEDAFTLPYLASTYGGTIPVRESKEGILKPETSVYRIRLELRRDTPEWKQAVRGVILVETRPWSIMTRIWERVRSVVIRESGF